MSTCFLFSSACRICRNGALVLELVRFHGTTWTHRGGLRHLDPGQASMRGFSQAQRDRAATELWSLKVRGCSELGSRGAGRIHGEKNLPLPRSAVCETSNSPGGTFPHHLRSRVSNPGRATESFPEGVPKPFCFGSPGCRCPLDRRLGPRAGSHSPPAHDGRCGHRGEAQGSAGRSLRWSQAH